MSSMINPKAWKVLSNDERLSLTLKHGYSRSSWEAGEIVGRAHYKFLEIEARAKQFVKMFHEHYELYTDLIPTYIKIDERVKRFFELTIEKRLSIKGAVLKIRDSKFKVSKYRTELIIQTISDFVNSESVLEQNIGNLILEFDRWNNYRILPREIQEPSAYKRRNKNYDIRNIKNLLTISPYSIKLLIKKYEAKHGSSHILYMPVFSPVVDDEDSIITIRKSLKDIAYLSSIGFYIFTRREKAEKFFNLVKDYDLKTRGKSCIDGQKFWPKYREAVNHSVNYNQVKKRIPSRKFLESALKDLDLIKLKNERNKNYKAE